MSGADLKLCPFAEPLPPGARHIAEFGGASGPLLSLSEDASGRPRLWFSPDGSAWRDLTEEDVDAHVTFTLKALRFFSSALHRYSAALRART